MASQLRIAVVTCLLLFVLMEDAKPVLAGKGKQRMKERELDQCDACSVILELMWRLKCNTIEEMASQLRIAVVTCLLLFVLMEDAKPVLAGKGKQRMKELDQCDACSVILELMWRLKCYTIEACKFDFEDGIDGWVRTGTAFDNQPTYGDNPTARNRGQPANQQGDWWIGTAENRPSPESKPGGLQGDQPTGTLTSPFFTIRGNTIALRIRGGCDANKARAELIIDGEVVKTATGASAGDPCTETMLRRTWDVEAYVGQRAQVRLVDDSSAGWAHINFDDLRGEITCD